jgi:hypothetical protein
VETIASLVAAAAGALETTKYAQDREWWRISLMGKTDRREFKK